jgi:hypothetical protein
LSGTFEEAIVPLLDAHAAIEADVAEQEAVLAELREKRNRLRNAVRALDPERLPANGSKQKRARGKKPFSSESLAYVRDFLLDREFQGEFGTTLLLEHPDYQGVRSTSLAPILRQLHEEGVIRLVRQGKGQSRYYEVIR